MRVPRAGQQPGRENTGQNEGAEPNHPKIYPTDNETAELLALWEALDNAARADVLAVVRGLSRRGLAGQHAVD